MPSVTRLPVGCPRKSSDSATYKRSTPSRPVVSVALVPAPLRARMFSRLAFLLVLLDIDRPVLDDAVVVENGHDGAGGRPERSMNPDTQPRSRLVHTTDVSLPTSFKTGAARLRPGWPVAGSGRKAPVAKSRVRRARSNARNPGARWPCDRVDSVCQHFPGRAVREQDVVVEDDRRARRRPAGVWPPGRARRLPDRPARQAGERRA